MNWRNSTADVPIFIIDASRIMLMLLLQLQLMALREDITKMSKVTSTTRKVFLLLLLLLRRRR